MRAFATEETHLPHWIFGYGSLIWRPGFEYQEKSRAVLPGWERRFWQGSTDHRGVPGIPGRVVTLIPAPKSQCVGVAFRLSELDREQILAQLDHREQGGYRRLIATVPLADGRDVSVLTYRADEDNPEYLGPAPMRRIADQISRSTGPSGSNREYLLNLHTALEKLGAADRHVADLVKIMNSLDR